MPVFSSCQKWVTQLSGWPSTYEVYTTKQGGDGTNTSSSPIPTLVHESSVAMVKRLRYQFASDIVLHWCSLRLTKTDQALQGSARAGETPIFISPTRYRAGRQVRLAGLDLAVEPPLKPADPSCEAQKTAGNDDQKHNVQGRHEPLLSRKINPSSSSGAPALIWLK